MKVNLPFSSSHKWIRYSVRIFLAGIAILLSAWLIVYLYFRSHKQEILQKTITLINNNVHGTITIEDVGIAFPETFPYVSIDLQNVTIHDSLFAKHGHELLNTKRLLLQANPFNFLTGSFTISKIQLEHGNIYLYEDSTGYNSADALKQYKDADSVKKESGSKLINAFRLVDINVIIDKQFKRKLYSFGIKDLNCKINSSGDELLFQVKTNMIINTLAFNLEKGTYAKNQPLTGDFELQYHKPSHTLNFKDIVLNIGKEPYHFTGKFNFVGQKFYTLNINAPQAVFSKAVALLPVSISHNIDSIEFDKTLAVNADLNGQLLPGVKPVVKVNWVIKDSRITSNFGTFEHTNFDGFFYNAIFDSLPHTGENSIIQVNNFTSSWEQVTLNSKKIAVTNLKKPVLNCDLRADAGLVTLNELLASESFEFNKGKIHADVVYSGPIYDSATDAPNINGFATIKDAAMIYGPRDIQFENFNGELIFKGTDVFFKNIKAAAQGNTISLDIAAINLLALMNSDPSKAQLDASVYSPQIDISKFTTLIGGRKQTVRKSKGKPQFKSMSAKIDNLLDKCNIRSDITADKITFKKFIATNFKANVYLSNLVWALQNTSFNHAGGTIKLDGAMRGGSKDYNPVNIKAVMSNLDIGKAFYAFNNFGLSSLNSKNLEGKLSSNINLSAALLDKAELVPSSLKGSISLSLKDGALNNFEPLEKMSVFLLKNRDFSHVNFSEIKNTFDFDGRMVNINRMEIQSTVLSLFMEGLYDMAGKSTDLVIQVPLSNLKKHKADYIPENKGVNSKTGASIFVNAKGNDKGDIDFSYSLFKKKKDKK